MPQFALPGSPAPAPLNPGVVCITNTGVSHYLFKENYSGFQAFFFFFLQLYQQSSFTFRFICLCSHRDVFTPEQTWKAESLSGLFISGTRTASGYTYVTLRAARLNDALVTENRSVFR